jgi:DnaJ-class molecular chaperone
MNNESDYLNMIIAEHTHKAETTYKVCPDCEGDMEQRSNCCYAPIDRDILICHECKEHAELAVCDTCNGEGRVIDED